PPTHTLSLHDALPIWFAGTAVTDEDRRLLAVADDVPLGQQRPAGPGGHALLHGLPAGGQARVAGAAGAVVPEIRGRGLALEQDLLGGRGLGGLLGGVVTGVGENRGAGAERERAGGGGEQGERTHAEASRHGKQKSFVREQERQRSSEGVAGLRPCGRYARSAIRYEEECRRSAGGR